MRYEFYAIYENGVIRPLVPLNLQNGTRVKVKVEVLEKSPFAEDLPSKQQIELKHLREQFDRFPQHKNNDI